MSDQLQLFAKEQERKKLLYSSAPQASSTAPATTKTPSTSKSTPKGNNKTPAAKKIQNSSEGGNKDAEEAGQMCGDGEVDTANNGLGGKGGKARGKSGAKRNKAGKKGRERSKQTQPEIPIAQSTPAQCECSFSLCTFHNRYCLKRTILATFKC